MLMLELPEISILMQHGNPELMRSASVQLEGTEWRVMQFAEYPMHHFQKKNRWHGNLGLILSLPKNRTIINQKRSFHFGSCALIFH